MRLLFAVVTSMVASHSIQLCNFALAQAKQEPVRLMSGGPGTVKALNPLKPELEKAAGMPVELLVNPVDSAMIGMVNGVVDGIFAANIPDTLAMAEKKGLPKQNIDNYQSHRVTEVVIKIAMHPDNPVKSLTSDQISLIMTGKAKNWKDVGGPDLPITVVIPKNYIGTIKVFLKHYTKKDNSDFATSVLDGAGMMRAMERDKGAIGISAIRDSTPTFKPYYLSSDAIMPVSIVMRKTARAPAQKVFDFLKARPPIRQD